MAKILMICKKRGGGTFQTLIVRGAGGRVHKFAYDKDVGGHVLRFDSVDEFHAADENIRSGSSTSKILTRIEEVAEAPAEDVAALRRELAVALDEIAFLKTAKAEDQKAASRRKREVAG